MSEFHSLCKGIIQLYEQEYLRAPTQDYLQRSLHVREIRGSKV
ncbi:hypothetical protein AALP_AA6G024400 [Arabis alpina]|uniref:Uncharacterized protein n=1 Tax=Arabis alpina TaxID=50452 RepID=A0A087GLM1_ARAAL|nr:hypothetical protein AALP_AA6G024400 [Arabis alpina]